MRLLLYGINYFPELTGIGKYTGELGAWLAARGHRVRVVTAPPYYPEWKIGRGYQAGAYRREDIAGAEVWRCPLWVPSRLDGRHRLAHLASFALSSLPVMFKQLFWRPDLILVIEPTFFCAPTALLTGRLCRAKVLLHIQDFEIDAGFDLGLLKNQTLRRLIAGGEKVLLRGFDRVSTISINMMDRLAEKGLKPEKILFFPNWVDTQSIFPLDGKNPLRAELGIDDDKIIALYSGNMGEKQGLEIIIAAARQLAEHPRLIFVLCGDGAARRRLQAQAKDLPNILWLPLQPLEKLNQLLNMADIHLLPQRAGAADLVMPSKLTGMMASGRAILATAAAGTQLAEVLRGERGVVVPPGDPRRFTEALELLAGDSERRQKLGKHARQYAEQSLAREVVLETFERDIKNLCGG